MLSGMLQCVGGYTVPHVSQGSGAFKMLAPIYPMIQHNMPDDLILQQHCCENLKSLRGEISSHSLRLKLQSESTITILWFWACSLRKC